MDEAKDFIDDIIISNINIDKDRQIFLQNYFYDNCIGNEGFLRWLEQYVTHFVNLYGQDSKNIIILKDLLRHPRRYFKKDPFIVMRCV
jgi:hypothetical protein